MQVAGYNHFGGQHGEATAIKNVLAFAGVRHPKTGEPLSEALCFGIAGGIGAGYSFCPSVPRWGVGSGVSVVGRHKSYATDASWYQGCCDRIGAKARITETGGAGKAFQNLQAELEAGRPTVVWCSRAQLPFLGNPMSSCNLWMHSFVVYGLDEDKGLAYGADRAPGPVTLSLDELAAARGGICSHKYRTLTLDPPKTLTAAALKSAVIEGTRACAKELLAGKMKTYSLPGLEIWAKMIANDTNKDGWLKVFSKGLLYSALKDTFDSIETAGTGGGLYRGLYAEFLDEAAQITGNRGLTDLALLYRDLAAQWTELADAALPDKLKPFKQTKALLSKKCQLFEDRGQKADKQQAEATAKLDALSAALRGDFPLSAEESKKLLEGLRERILALHVAESQAAQRLQAAVA